MIAIIPLLALVAFFAAIGAAVSKVPLWVSVLILCLIVLLQVWR